MRLLLIVIGFALLGVAGFYVLVAHRMDQKWRKEDDRYQPGKDPDGEPWED